MAFFDATRTFLVGSNLNAGVSFGRAIFVVIMLPKVSSGFKFG